MGYPVESKTDIPLANETMNSFDVWGWNTVDDAVDTMRMQRKRYLELRAQKDAEESGLTLMAAVKESKVNPLNVLQKIIRNPQVATLHFIKSKQAQFIIEKKQIRNGIAAANEEKTMQELEDDEMKIVKNRIEFIKELSTQTNLKHMLIGTRGGCSLFRALENNGFLTKLVLSKARLTDEAIEAFIIAFPTMKVSFVIVTFYSSIFILYEFIPVLILSWFTSCVANIYVLTAESATC